MRRAPDPWILPGPSIWLERISAQLDHGLARIAVDPAMPQGLVEALLDRDSRRHATSMTARPGQTPAVVLAEGFGSGVAPQLDALLRPELENELAIVTLARLGSEDLRNWRIFLDRFFKARSEGAPGPALLLPEAPAELSSGEAGALMSWRASLRRGDLAIWAEEHLPETRTGVLAELVVAMAIRLCEWRLDLAAELTRAGFEDLTSPLDWLKARPEAEILGGDPACPLELARGGRIDQLSRRIWLAQLTALFPKLEQERLDLVERYKGRLRVGPQLEAQGVETVEELELGAISYQLWPVLGAAERNCLAALARIRNALAHRKTADTADIRALLKI